MDITNNKKIPDQILEFAKSAELYAAVEKIGEQFGLHIDQMGELDAEIRDILNGQSDSATFTKAIQQRLEIDGTLAEKIRDAVNKDVFEALKENLKTQIDVAPSPNTVSSIEKVGGFEVDEQKNGATPPADVTEEDKGSILKGIENPPPGNKTVVEKEQDEKFNEPMVDRILMGKSEPKPDVPPQSEPKQQIRPGPDPYRETL